MSRYTVTGYLPVKYRREVIYILKLWKDLKALLFTSDQSIRIKTGVEIHVVFTPSFRLEE